MRAGEAGAAPRSFTVKAALDCEGRCYPPLDEDDRQRYSYFVDQLDTLEYFRKPDPSSDFVTPHYPPLDDDEMRITFMGSCIPPVRRAQNMMSIFVEVGWDEARQCAKDSFVFDCGAGVVGNYGAMEVGYRRMDKVFITHLHGDHMSDLTHIYCFGPSGDRLTPFYVFGPSASASRTRAAPPIRHPSKSARSGACPSRRDRSVTIRGATASPSCLSSSTGPRKVASLTGTAKPASRSRTSPSFTAAKGRSATSSSGRVSR